MGRSKLNAGWMAQVVAHLERAYPDEGCGLILRTEQGSAVVRPMTNIAVQGQPPAQSASPRTRRDAYSIDPLEIVRAAGRGERLEIIFHSHCDHSDELSYEDRRQALTEDGAPLWPGCQYLIVAIYQGVARHATLHQFNPSHRRFDVVEASPL